MHDRDNGAADLSDCALAIFTRSPRAGHTKSRLAPLLGDQGAMAAHVELVQGVLRRLRSLPRKASPAPQFSLWASERCATVNKWACSIEAQLCLQVDGDLGMRMQHTLVSLLGDGVGRACLIGTDCPGVDAAYVSAAFAALQDAQLVLGPVEDGGYVLIGARREVMDTLPVLFADIPWSTPEVLAITLQRAAAAGMTVSQLPQLWDVDTPQDWYRYQQWLAEDGA